MSQHRIMWVPWDRPRVQHGRGWIRPGGTVGHLPNSNGGWAHDLGPLISLLCKVNRMFTALGQRLPSVCGQNVPHCRFFLHQMLRKRPSSHLPWLLWFDTHLPFYLSSSHRCLDEVTITSPAQAGIILTFIWDDGILKRLSWCKRVPLILVPRE